MSVALGQGTGPLRGVRVVELAGIGPGPHAAMILADLGADVIRVDRPGGQPLTGGATDLLNRGRPSVALDLKHPDGVATVLGLVETADVLARGPAPRYDRAARPRPRRLPGPQPAAGLRPDDRLGPGRPARADRRPRPRLHRDHRRALRDGPGPRAPALPGQPGRRLRRRLDVPRDRGPRRAPRVPALRRGPGGRRRDRRRHRPPQRDGRRLPGRRASTASSGRPTSSTAAPRSTTSTRPPTAGTSPSAPSSRSSTTSWSRLLGIADIAPDRNDPANHPELRRLIAEAVEQPDAGRVDRRLRGLRRLRRAGAADDRGLRAPPPGRARAPSSSATASPSPRPAPRFSRTAPDPHQPAAGAAGQDTRDALDRLGHRRRRRAARLRRGGRGLSR